MAVLKCKMCGGNLEIVDGASVCVCEYCGTKQTVPKIDDEKKIKLFERANRLRMSSEFDKAYGVYEAIVEEFPTEAEAYWGLVLCRYGIEYVDDPKTGNKIPTCHRSSFDSIFEDGDFEQALENADAVAKKVYREEAKAIEEIRRGIVEISVKEEPYDIFICYKETDEHGERTIDSVIAQDVYEALTAKKYKLFFARISLEDKLGKEYEPYIFSALHSAKVMLVFGTDYEYFNAVWVKNEWSRFLKLIEQGEKKTLIPCYKDIDAYDMPKEFARLQAQDMGKVGAIQDLVRGIGKIIVRKEEKIVVQHTAASALGSFAEPLVSRGMDFLKDQNYTKANEFFEKALDYEPHNENALLGKLFLATGVTGLEELFERDVFYNTEKAYVDLTSVCSEELKQRLEEGNAQIYERISKAGQQSLEAGAYTRANACFDKLLSVNPRDDGALVGKLLIEYGVSSLQQLFESGVFCHDSENYELIMARCSAEVKKGIQDGFEQMKEDVLARAQEQLQGGSYESAFENYSKVLSVERSERVYLGVFLAECKVKSLEELEKNEILFRQANSYSDMINACSQEKREQLYAMHERIRAAYCDKIQIKLNVERYKEAIQIAKEILSESPNDETSLLLWLFAEKEVKSLEELSSSKTSIARNQRFIELIRVGSDETKKRIKACEDHIQQEIARRQEAERRAKIRRFIITASVCIVVALSIIIPVSVYLNSNGYLYGLEDAPGGVVISHDNKLESEIVNGHLEIPAEIDGVPVVGIGSSAFRYCTSLESITIPNGVISIGDSAFDNCTSLASITIPNSVTSIGYKAFWGCTSLTSITIPESVTSIGSYAFSGCSIKEATVPARFIDNIRNSYLETLVITSGDSIGEKALFNCKSLKNVTLPNSVTSIGSSAFEGCTSLTGIKIPKSVTSIGYYAFYNCISLTKIYFNAEAMADLNYDSYVFYNAGNAEGGIEVTVGKEVSRIPACLFRSHDSSYSPKITSVSFKKSGVCKSIGVSAFERCIYLTSITIPKSVTTMGNYAFSGCTRLKEINFNAKAMEDLNSDNYVFHKAGADRSGIRVTIGNEVTKIPAYLFCSHENYTSELPEITSVVFEENSVCKSIGSYAFRNCAMTSIAIPESVTHIGESAFRNCAMASIAIPESVTSIGSSAFENCKSLRSITIPDSVTSVGEDAFLYCPIKEATLPARFIASIRSSCLEKVVITSGDGIGSNAFEYCTSLTSITIPESVTRIGSSAFKDCTSLTSVTIPNSVTSIGSFAFYYCSSLTSIIIPEGVTSIGDSAFEECTSLTSITIPESVTRIGSSAFEDCTSLTSITIPESVTSIGTYAFWCCTSLTSITIPEGVTSIGDSAFYYCSSLTSIKIPESVTSIGSSAFYRCTSLTIYCEAESQPSGWDRDWNYNGGTVIWGYK